MKTPSESARIERSLRQRLLSAYRRNWPVPPDRIVVGFSGGPDSLALAILLVGIQRAMPSSIYLLHVDHRIRPGSGEDAALCAMLADHLGLPFTSLRVSAHPQTLHPNVGLEEAARRARYETFAGFGRNGDLFALAHHAGDQAETVLLHLMHGAGTSGMAGMRAASEIPVPWWQDTIDESTHLTIWRPLLTERRDDLLTIVGRSGLTPLLDPSNNDTSLRRNAIRHQAVPALQTIEPTIEERLGTLARIAADEDVLLEEQTGKLLAQARLACGGLSIEVLDEAPVALARRAVRQWLEQGQALSPTFDRVEAVLGLVRSRDRAAKVETGEGLLAGCFGDALRAGTLTDLTYRAWLDAGLMLPLVGSGHHVGIDDVTITVAVAFNQKRCCAQRSLEAPGTIGIGPVFSGVDSSDSGRWKEWFRQVGVSPWIRDLVQGVTIDGAVWWIPRHGDYDDAGGGRRVRVVWSEQGQEQD
jgi:tRNA(Ile)-lysidine synthetase-like protein